MGEVACSHILPAGGRQTRLVQPILARQTPRVLTAIEIKKSIAPSSSNRAIKQYMKGSITTGPEVRHQRGLSTKQLWGQLPRSAKTLVCQGP
jgi:hypothetical protein